MAATRSNSTRAVEMLDEHRRAARSIVVWKFGGTSVRDHDRMRAVAQRMVDAKRAGHQVVAVLSAMGKTTDELTELAYQMSDRPPLRELDALLSVGETISCSLTAMAVHELGERAVSFTGGQAGILTDDTHGNARVRGICPDRVVAALDEGAIALVTGFQGATADGAVTTMGRGGSDASAVAMAAALGVSECEIFTDVPAVFTADPRVVPNARRLRELRHEEMLELAEAGAGVLQPRSVELAAAHGVDIHLRSSFTTEAGTWIRRGGSGSSGQFEDTGVAGVAHRVHEPLYNVLGMSAAQVTTTLAARGAAVGVILPGSSGAVRFTAPGVSPAEVAAALAGPDTELDEPRELGSVSVVSLGIARKPALVAQVLAVLEKEGIAHEFVTTTPGRVTVHLESGSVADAARLLHDTFVSAAHAMPGDQAA